MSATAIVVEPRAAAVVLADDPPAVSGAGAPQVTGHGLPLLEVLAHQPVDQLADFALDLLRRVGDDLLLEALLHAAAIEQIHHAADSHRLVEVVLSAALHLEQDAIDVGHAEVEVAHQVVAIDAELPIHFVERGEVVLEESQPIARERRGGVRPAMHRRPSGFSSFRCIRPGASSVAAM